LALILLHIPGFTLVYINSTLSSILSYLSYGLILVFVFLHGKSGNCSELLWVGALYFLIGILVSQEYMIDAYSFYVQVIKYFIIVWGGYEVMKCTTPKELRVFMMIGAFSILGNIFLFNDPEADYGRYSGFYLDPNNGGLICLIGLSLTFSVIQRPSFLSKPTFTALGLFTFSRTFMLSWLLVNLLSVRLNLSNVKILIIGFFGLLLLIQFNDFLPVKSQRLDQLGAMITGQQQRTGGLEKDSREETWSKYYNALMDRPIFGNGYYSFMKNGVARIDLGVHNFYMYLWGESGIFTLSVFLGFLTKLFVRSIKQFQAKPYLLMMLIAMALFLMTNHNFMTNDYSIFLIMWIAIQSQPTTAAQLSQASTRNNNHTVEN
ncbi:MAG: O-antigen ligase family protein, partial [Bacteroidota bacterium]